MAPAISACCCCCCSSAAIAQGFLPRPGGATRSRPCLRLRSSSFSTMMPTNFASALNENATHASMRAHGSHALPCAQLFYQCNDKPCAEMVTDKANIGSMFALLLECCKDWKRARTQFLRTSGSGAWPSAFGLPLEAGLTALLIREAGLTAQSQYLFRLRSS